MSNPDPVPRLVVVSLSSFPPVPRRFRVRYPRARARRPVEKVAREIVKNALPATQSDETLFTASQAQTLVRIVGNLCFNKDSPLADTDVNLLLVIRHEPEGVTLPTISAGAGVVLDAEQHILHGFAARFNDGWVEPLVHYVDVRAMRKLKEGDVIRLSLDTNQASAIDVSGFLTLFLKQ